MRGSIFTHPAFGCPPMRACGPAWQTASVTLDDLYLRAAPPTRPDNSGRNLYYSHRKLRGFAPSRDLVIFGPTDPAPERARACEPTRARAARHATTQTCSSYEHRSWQRRDAGDGLTGRSCRWPSQASPSQSLCVLCVFVPFVVWSVATC